MAESVRVGLVQMSASEERSVNLERALAGTRQAFERGAQVICHQELFASRYFCDEEDLERFALAEPIPGPSSEPFQALCKELGVTLVTSVFERRAAGVYHNTALVIDDQGSIVGRYRKMHIPDDPQFYEKFYFTPGDLGFVACPTRHATLGPLVCWDQWFPEAARLTALKGAQILFYPTAIGWLPDEKAEFGEAQLAAWQTMMKSHAIANGVFVVAVNRVGHEAPPSGIEFWGHSFVCDPFGRVLAEGGTGEEVLVVECDLNLIETTRREWPFLRDRRIDAYQGLDARLLDAPPSDGGK